MEKHDQREWWYQLAGKSPTIRVQVAMAVGSNDPRYRGDAVDKDDSRHRDYDDPDFNDGVLVTREQEFESAAELWQELNKYDKFGGVVTTFGQIKEGGKVRNYIEHYLKFENDAFNQDIARSRESTS